MNVCRVHDLHGKFSARDVQTLALDLASTCPSMVFIYIYIYMYSYP